jgi:hypothetical protein
MSLNYKYADVKEEFHTNPFDTDEIHPVMNACVWLTMILGVPCITEKTEDEFYARLCAWRGVDPQSGVLEYNDATYKFTLQDIVNYRGLRTNSTPLTKAQFAKKIMETATRTGSTNQVYSAHVMVAERHAAFVAKKEA